MQVLYREVPIQSREDRMRAAREIYSLNELGLTFLDYYEENIDIFEVNLNTWRSTDVSKRNGLRFNVTDHIPVYSNS